MPAADHTDPTDDVTDTGDRFSGDRVLGGRPADTPFSDSDHVRGEPVLITDAPISYEEQLAARKKRYLLTMGMRIPFLIGAAACYQIPWLAVTLIALSVPLPWIAVLIANDGPVRDTKRRRPLEGTISYERAIGPVTPVTHVIDADPDPGAPRV
ncbi:DUF3099 domain-containing protein [Nakamurella silvestris]|nr:DUF3099 domain-containing protein [Nakamurella silvestris]